jgi:hypothetical protein
MFRSTAESVQGLAGLESKDGELSSFAWHSLCIYTVERQLINNGICMKINLTPFFTLIFICLATSIRIIAADKEENQLYKQYCEHYKELPQELKDKLKLGEADYFNKMLYFRENLSLSLQELRDYSEIIVVLSSENSLSINRLNLLSLKKLTDEVVGADRSKIGEAKSQDPDLLQLALRQPAVKNITHQLLIDAYALSLRFLSNDDNDDFEYIARIVYYTRLSPQLIVTILDEKTTTEEFSKQLFGRQLVEICMQKESGKAFIHKKELHQNFRNRFFTVLIEDGIVPLSLLPTTIIPRDTNLSISDTNVSITESCQSLEWSMRIADYISPRHRIQYGINTQHQPLALVEKIHKNKKMCKRAQTHYFVDEKWAHAIVDNARSRTDYEEDKKIIVTLSTSASVHQLLINGTQTYEYQAPVDVEEKNRHVALSYFLHLN